MKNPSTYTLCTGRASSIEEDPPSHNPWSLALPMLNSPPGIHTMSSGDSPGTMEFNFVSAYTVSTIEVATSCISVTPGWDAELLHPVSSQPFTQHKKKTCFSIC